MNKKKGFLKSYHRIKFAELILLIIIEVTYFCIIYNDRRLRTAVYANPVLFRLCCMMWAVLIFSLLFLCIDFYLLRRAVNDNYDLNRVAYLDTLTGIPNRNSVDMLIGIIRTRRPRGLPAALFLMPATKNVWDSSRTASTLQSLTITRSMQLLRSCLIQPLHCRLMRLSLI
jgi:cbb3-type cytochrome oxidase subunit 3